MGLYESWCDASRKEDKRKRYWTYIEKDGGRDEILDDLAETIRSHYDRLERIADDVDRLGYKAATKILSDHILEACEQLCSLWPVEGTSDAD